MSRELLGAFARFDGAERVALYWTSDGQRHAFEIGRERRTLEGWRLLHRITFPPGEVFLLHDAVGMACERAKGVRR
jgi:hypothetical protein